MYLLQTLKFIDLRRTPSLEIGMMMVFCYTPYALAEGLHLSGIVFAYVFIYLNIYPLYILAYWFERKFTIKNKHIGLNFSWKFL